MINLKRKQSVRISFSYNTHGKRGEGNVKKQLFTMKIYTFFLFIK